MKLRAERGEFVDAISWTTRTVGPRPALPALAGVLLDARSGRLTCRATDLEVSTEVHVRVNVEQPGVALLPGRLIAQIAARLPDAPVEIERSAERISIKCGRASFVVRDMTPENFPAIPEPAEDAPRAVVKAEDFARLVAQVSRAAAADDARPVLTGVKLEASADALVAAATDSYRLAVRKVAWDRGADAQALVPARALAEAAKAAPEAGGEVTIVFEDGQVTFLFGDRRLTTTLVEGSFPNYRQLLPEDYETLVTVERAALVETLQRVAVVALGQANTPVILTFGDGSVQLSVTSQETGEASEALPAEIEGDEITIAFNPGFLLTGLEAIDTEYVTVELRDGLKPAVIRPKREEPEDFTYLLMPVRTN